MFVHTSPRVMRGWPALLSIAALLGVALLPAPAASNDADLAGWIQQCTDDWNDAPASTYCSGATVSRITAEGDQQGHCTVGASCSITVAVDDTNTTYTPSINLTLARASTNSIDLCFSVTADCGVSVNARAGCNTDETSSATATADGLETSSSNNNNLDLLTPIDGIGALRTCD